MFIAWLSTSKITGWTTATVHAEDVTEAVAGSSSDFMAAILVSTYHTFKVSKDSSGLWTSATHPNIVQDGEVQVVAGSSEFAAALEGRDPYRVYIAWRDGDPIGSLPPVAQDPSGARKRPRAPAAAGGEVAGDGKRRHRSSISASDIDAARKSFGTGGKPLEADFKKSSTVESLKSTLRVLGEVLSGNKGTLTTRVLASWDKIDAAISEAVTASTRGVVAAEDELLEGEGGVVAAEDELLEGEGGVVAAEDNDSELLEGDINMGAE